MIFGMNILDIKHQLWTSNRQNDRQKVNTGVVELTR